MSPLSRLTEKQIDIIREIGNIGMGHAATAMSQLIGQKVMLRVPQITITDITRVPDLLGGAEKLVVGITLQILGDARGNILLIFPRESALRLLSSLISSDEKGWVLDELSSSALREVGNILASAYLNALGSLLRLSLIPSIPLLAYDMAGAVVDHVLIELSRAGEEVMVVKTEFLAGISQEEMIRGHVLLLPDPRSLEIFLQAVGDGG
jgi:chemotaxis protein CheC